MILCKFEKTGTAVFTPHLNIMRGFVMAMRRKGLRIAYSEGFNPHPKLYLSPPPPVGLCTRAEYLAVDSPENPDEFMQKMNASLQPGVRILQVASSIANPNFAAVVAACRYEVAFESPVDLPDFQEILAAKSYEISFEQKGETVTKDIRSCIYELSGTEKKLSMLLAYGNKNLRADRLLCHLLRLSNADGVGYSICKTHAYGQGGHDIDELFFGGVSK